jgi:hypothetical protein
VGEAMPRVAGEGLRLVTVPAIFERQGVAHHKVSIPRVLRWVGCGGGGQARQRRWAVRPTGMRGKRPPRCLGQTSCG